MRRRYSKVGGLGRSGEVESSTRNLATLKLSGKLHSCENSGKIPTMRKMAATNKELISLDDQRDDARAYQYSGPQEIEIEPGALEDHQAEPVVDHQCDQCHHREHRQGVHGDRREVGECRRGRQEEVYAVAPVFVRLVRP